MSSLSDTSSSITKQCIAVKAIITDTEGKVLVLKQSDDAAVDGAGRYHPPGGIVEPGETLLETLRREVREETTLEIDIHKLLAVEEWHVNIRGDDCYFVGIFYECKLKSGSIALQADEASAYKWVSEQDMVTIDILEPSKKVIKSSFDS